MKSFMVYILCGSLGAGVNFLSRMGYNHVVGFAASVILAYFTGMLVNFILSKHLAFASGSSRRSYRELTKFFLVTGFALLATLSVSLAALSLLSTWVSTRALSAGMLQKLSHLAGIGSGFIINFLGHKFFSFRPTGIWDKLIGAWMK